MIDWPDAAKQGSLYAAGINVVLLGALVLTRRWWSLRGAGDPAPPDGGSAGAGRTPVSGLESRAMTHFWLGLAGLLIVATVLRVPLARSSLWWDEVWQARNASVGEWRPDKKSGGLKFRETTFAQALWNYRKPANHPPMAVTSKACHEVWRKVTGAKPGAFNEFVLRLPGFVASLAGIALIALLLRAWGLPGAGLVAAFFLALHPWHIRYGIDNRGYTFLVPLTLIGLWSLWRACGPPERGRVLLAAGGDDEGAAALRPRVPAGHSAGAWWIFGVNQALILWSHLLSVWVCLALCGTGVWWVWRQHTGPDRWRRMARLAAVQVAGAMVFFQLFLPNLLQATQWGEKNQDGRLLDGPVLVDTLTQVAVGPAQGWGTLVVWLLAVVGLVLAWQKRVAGTAGVAFLLASAGMFLAAVWAAGFYFYPRFLFAVTVPLAMAVGMAVWWIGCREFGGHWRARALGAAMVFAAMAGGGLGNGLKPVVADGFSPLRETAAALRQAEAEGAHVFGYGFGAEALQYYLPTLQYAREADAPEALDAAVEKARAAGKPLLVATGYEDLNRIALPQGFTLLDDSSRATVVWSEHGLEPQFAYRIRRFEPAR